MIGLLHCAFTVPSGPWDLTVFAFTIRSSGSAIAAVPSAENFRTSRRDTSDPVMAVPFFVSLTGVTRARASGARRPG